MACRTQPPKATQYSTKMTDKKHRVVGTKRQDGHQQPGCWGSSSRYNLSPEPAELENSKRPCGEMPTCRPGTGAAEAGETYILDPKSTTVNKQQQKTEWCNAHLQPWRWGSSSRWSPAGLLGLEDGRLGRRLWPAAAACRAWREHVGLLLGPLLGPGLLLLLLAPGRLLPHWVA